MTMELLTSPTPNGWKVTIMVEELREAGVDLADLTVTPINIMKGDQFTDAFTAVNPNQKIPALVDGDRNIIESCAILQYLGEKFPTSLLPQGEARWDVLPWVYWQAANVGPIFGNKLAYTRYITDVPDEARAHPLEELVITPIDIMKGDQFTDAFTAVNLNQKIPALVDGDRRWTYAALSKDARGLAAGLKALGP